LKERQGGIGEKKAKKEKERAKEGAREAEADTQRESYRKRKIEKARWGIVTN
jgi:hypothetical protein